MIFGPESAADEGGNHLHLRFGQAEHAGQAVADGNRRLGRVPDRQLFALRIPRRRHGAVLDRRRGPAVVEEPARDHQVGGGAGDSVVALALVDVGGEVGGQLLVQQWGIRQERALEIDDGPERLDLDGDVGDGVLSQITAIGHHHRDRLADVPHLVFGERHLRAGVEDHARHRRRRHQQRPRLPVVAQVGGGVDGDDARTGARRRDIHRAEPPVRVDAADERHVQHPGQLHVVDEQRPAGQQSGVFVAGDATTEIRRHGRGRRP